MPIKIKNRDPKSTDFSPNDIIINIKDGTIFYKSKDAVFKIKGDNIATPTTEITPLGDGLTITGSLNIDGRATGSCRGAVEGDGSGLNNITIDGGGF